MPNQKGVEVVLFASLLFPHSFKRSTVLLYVHELAIGRVPFHVLLRDGVKNLRTVAHCAVTVAVAGRVICSHRAE